MVHRTKPLVLGICWDKDVQFEVSESLKMGDYLTVHLSMGGYKDVSLSLIRGAGFEVIVLDGDFLEKHDIELFRSEIPDPGIIKIVNDGQNSGQGNLSQWERNSGIVTIRRSEVTRTLTGAVDYLLIGQEIKKESV